MCDPYIFDHPNFQVLLNQSLYFVHLFEPFDFFTMWYLDISCFENTVVPDQMAAANRC